MSTEGLKSASETAKQLISLSTGIIALTVTFVEKFKPASAKVPTVPATLQLAWGSFVFVILFGIMTLMAITGVLNNVDNAKGGPDAFIKSITIPASLMILTFLLAMVLTICTGVSIST